MAGQARPTTSARSALTAPIVEYGSQTLQVQPYVTSCCDYHVQQVVSNSARVHYEAYTSPIPGDVADDTGTWCTENATIWSAEWGHDHADDVSHLIVHSNGQVVSPLS